MSLLLDVESSARHRGTLVSNRSFGPRHDIDHLELRKEVCCKVLARCASDISFNVMGTSIGELDPGVDPLERVRVRREDTNSGVTYKLFDGTQWIPLSRRCIARQTGKKTIFVFNVGQGSSETTEVVSCPRFDGDAVAAYLSLPSQPRVLGTSLQQQSRGRTRGSATRRLERRSEPTLLTWLRLLGTSSGTRITIKTSRPYRRVVEKLILCELKDEYVNSKVRLEFQVESSSCRLYISRKVRQWQRIPGYLPVDSIKARLDEKSVLCKMNAHGITLLVSSTGPVSSFKTSFRSIHSERDGNGEKGRKENLPEYLYQHDVKRIAVSSRQFIMSKKSTFSGMSCSNVMHEKYHSVEACSNTFSRHSNVHLTSQTFKQSALKNRHW